MDNDEYVTEAEALNIYDVINDRTLYKVVSCILLLGIIIQMPYDYFIVDKASREAIEQCEQSIPRDQSCKLIAVVDDTFNSK